jgi:hypothetical protein
MPLKTCVITGDNASRMETIRFFKPLGIQFIEYTITLPFSEKGWQVYQRKLPKALSLFKWGLHLCFSVPFLFYVLVPFYFIPVGILLSPIIAVEMLFGRNQLILLHDPIDKHLNISVPSKAFLAELVFLNTGLSIEEYHKRFFIRGLE